MNRIPQRSTEDTEQEPTDDYAEPIVPVDQAPYQPINQLQLHVNNQSTNLSSHSSGLLAYNFIMPLVAEYLDDGDVVARLSSLSTSIRKVLPKYTIKRICHSSRALDIIGLKSGIALSVSKVRADNSNIDELLKVIVLNSEPLAQVHYKFIGVPEH